MSQLPPSEFQRVIDIDRITSKQMSLEANAAECAALAERFGLRELTSLTADMTIRAEAERHIAEGRVTADIVQICSLSGEDVPAHIDAPFRLVFVHESQLEAVDTGEDEIELDSDDLDIIGYEGSNVDLGETVAQTLALALDPYPRAPDAEKMAAPWLGDIDESGPFAALKGLKKNS
jgi:uncharacterized metal-binding protein YceD (DUF177 family)